MEQFMPQIKHNVTLDDLYIILQEMNQRLIAVETSARPSVPEPVEGTGFHRNSERTPGTANVVPADARGQSKNEAFRAALRRTHGAWAANPWKNAMEDIRAMREEWGHRDFWTLLLPLLP
jgi:hypothetical protein